MRILFLLCLSQLVVTNATAQVVNDFSSALARTDAEIAFLNEKLIKDPKSFLTAIELGQAYHSKARLTGSLADYRSAENAFRKSLTIYSEHNVDAKIGLTAALASQHRFNEAQQIISPLVVLATDKSTLWAVAGDIAFELGDYELAKTYYEQLLDTKPGLVSWSRMAKMHLLLGRWYEAKVLWEKCTALPVGSDPEPSAWALTMFGDIYLRKGDIPNARERFQQALNILPGYPVALEHLAETFELERNDERAALLLDSAMALFIHHDLMFRKAAILERSGKKSESMEIRHKAINLLEEELANGDIGHRRVLAEAILELGQNPKQVLKLAEEELRDRGNIGAEMLVARALAANGRIREALPHIERALKYNSFEPELLKHAVELYSLADEAAEAARIKSKLELMNPSLAADLLVENNSPK